MGVTCCVPNCHTEYNRHKGLTFHVIPKENELRAKYLTAIRNDKPAASTKVCSLHFKGGVKSYREVPSIFPWCDNWEEIVTQHNKKVETALALKSLSGISGNTVKFIPITINKSGIPKYMKKPLTPKRKKPAARHSTPLIKVSLEKIFL